MSTLHFVADDFFLQGPGLCEIAVREIGQRCADIANSKFRTWLKDQEKTLPAPQVEDTGPCDYSRVKGV